MDIFERLSVNEISVQKSFNEGVSEKELDMDDLFSGTVVGEVPPKRKASDYLRESVGWVYACTSAIADELANIRLRLYTMDKKGNTKEIFEDPILDVLYRANNMMTKYDLFWLTGQYLELAGESPWFIVRDNNGKGDPNSIFLLRPDRMTPIINENPNEGSLISAYRYIKSDGGTEKLDPKNVVFLKYPDPNSPFRGKGTLEAVAKTADIENFSEDFNLQYFYNGAHPSSVINTANKMNAVQKESLRRSLKMLFTGRKNAHKTLILENGLEWKPMMLTHKDMEFLEQMKFSRDKILAIFRVPRTVLGITDDVNRANAEATDLVFAKRTIRPKMQRIVEQLNEFFVPLFSGSEGKFLDFDDPTPEDNELRFKRYESGLGKGWMTINEVRKEENLEDLGETGNVPMVPNSLVPLGTPPTVAPQSVRGLSINYDTRVAVRQRMAAKRNVEKVKSMVLGEIRNGIVKYVVPIIKDQLKESAKTKKFNDQVKKSWTIEMKEAFWNQMIKTASQFEKKFNTTVTDIFEDQKRRILDKFPEKGIDIDKFLLDIGAERKIGIKILLPIYKGIVKEQSKNTFNLIGNEGDELSFSNPAVQSFLDKRTFDLTTEMSQTTNDLLGKTLKDGISAGESIKELQRRVESMFQDMEAYRSERIARTETIEASNFASVQSYKESGLVDGKEWLTALDERTSETCEELDGQVVGLNESFKSSDGSIDHPPLHPNCRCTVVPVINKGVHDVKVKDREISLDGVDQEIDLALREVEVDRGEESIEKRVLELDAKESELKKSLEESKITKEEYDKKIQELSGLRDEIIDNLNG